MRSGRAGQRGMTLIELMLSMALSVIVINGIVMVVFMQTRAVSNQMQYAEAQQNARASLALLKRYARLAGWGMAASVDADGVVPFGACHNTASNSQQLACDGVDPDGNGVTGWPGGSDRLRVVFMQADTGGALHNERHTAAAGTLPVGLLNDPDDGAALAVPAGHPMAANTLAVVSGPCIGTGVASDLLTITGQTSPVTTHFEYNYANFQDGSGNLTCTAGYGEGFGVGTATVADFWIDRTTDPDHPRLMLRLDPSQPLSDAYIVAYDIDDLQVRFLLDSTCESFPSGKCPDALTPDHIWDQMCDDPSSGLTGQGGCSDSFTPRQRLARAVGAEIAIVARTRNYQDNLDKGGGPLTVQNHTYTGKDDGYRRWIYRATVALRNNEK